MHFASSQKTLRMALQRRDPVLVRQCIRNLLDLSLTWRCDWCSGQLIESVTDWAARIIDRGFFPDWTSSHARLVDPIRANAKQLQIYAFWLPDCIYFPIARLGTAFPYSRLQPFDCFTDSIYWPGAITETRVPITNSQFLSTGARFASCYILCLLLIGSSNGHFTPSG